MNKKNLYMIVACLVAVLLVCVLIVGMIDGVWPWSVGKNPADGYTGVQSNPSTETTETTETKSAEESTQNEETTAETTKPEGSAGTGNTATKPTGNAQTPTETTQPDGQGEPVEPTYDIVLGDQENTESDDSDYEIKFSDLVGAWEDNDAEE